MIVDVEQRLTRTRHTLGVPMTTAPQARIRSWARSQGMTVNNRGSLPASVTLAYTVAHTTSTGGTTVTSPTRKTTARKTTARKTSKAATKPARVRKAVATPARRAASARPRAAVAPAPTVDAVAPAPGATDLAGGLRSYLGSIEVEVREVSSLSQGIDKLVVELNDLRDQQAKRLIVLDELRASVTDQSLGSFLDQAIKPRKTRVPEIIPERLL